MGLFQKVWQRAVFSPLVGLVDNFPSDTIFVNDTSEFSGAGIDRDNSSEQKPLWFEHEPCFDYWVGKGKGAVSQLNIPLIPGFTTS